MTLTREQWNKALCERYGLELCKRFSTAAVAICGLGGLGSNVAIALARAGIGKLILIDFDQVDVTNLHRQHYKVCQVGKFKTEALTENLKEIAPYVIIEAYTERITEDNISALLGKADIVCEAFDNAESKAMLTNAVLETMPDKYLVATSGMAGMGSANSIKTRRLTKRFYLCGDGMSDVGEVGSLVAPRVMLCASHQAHTVLRILSQQFEI